MLKNNLMVFNPKTLVFSLWNIYDRQHIEQRRKNTYYNKIIGTNETTETQNIKSKPKY